MWKDIFIFYIGCKALDGVTPLYINFYKINIYIEDDNRIKNLTLIHMDENKGEFERYKKHEIKSSIEKN